MNNKSGWQLCGDGPEVYEKYIVPAFSGAWAQDIVNRAALRNGDRILDLGCGTGIVSRYANSALGELGHITGIDISLVIKQMRYYPLDEFFVGGLVASPFAKDIIALEDSKREEMFHTIKKSISNYVDDHGLAAPMESYVICATT